MLIESFNSFTKLSKEQQELNRQWRKLPDRERKKYRTFGKFMEEKRK